MSEVVPRIRTLCGPRGQRIGEASNLGPASRRRRTQRLRGFNGPWTVIQSLRTSVVMWPRGWKATCAVKPAQRSVERLRQIASRRVVVAPQTPEGTPQSVHDVELSALRPRQTQQWTQRTSPRLCPQHQPRGPPHQEDKVRQRGGVAFPV